MNNGSVTGGIRTPVRNKHPKISGHPRSKHLDEFGWGLACDIVFDAVGDVPKGRTYLNLRGYHTYQGEDYEPTRIHVQYFGYGIKPPEVEEVVE